MEVPQDFESGRIEAGLSDLYDKGNFPLVPHLDLDHCRSLTRDRGDGNVQVAADRPTMHYTLRSCEAGLRWHPRPRATAGATGRLRFGPDHTTAGPTPPQIRWRERSGTCWIQLPTITAPSTRPSTRSVTDLERNSSSASCCVRCCARSGAGARC